MKSILLTVMATVMLLSGALPVCSGQEKELSANEIASKVYHREVGTDMQMTGRMELISENGYVREREMITLRLDTPDERRVLIRFTAPADIRDTAFLVIENTEDHSTRQHLYLPALKRVRRIVASQQGRSFVNSDFTYEDMQRHPLDEWEYRLKPSAAVSGQECYVLVSTPVSATETQYGKIVSWVDKRHFLPLRTHFWNTNGEHVKTYTVEKVELIQGIATEMVVVMEDHEDKHKTRLTTEQVRYNSGLPQRMFTIRALEP